jgi:hypothetical protein
MVTFQNDGTILAKFNERYFKFTEDGNPLDEIEFENRSLRSLGEIPYHGDDSSYYAIYWHEFQF